MKLEIMKLSTHNINCDSCGAPANWEVEYAKQLWFYACNADLSRSMEIVYAEYIGGLFRSPVL